MKHCRTDYQGIQDIEGKTSIKDDEPVFLLRAQDALAPSTLEYWAKKLKEVNGDFKTANRILDFADEMRVWAATNGNKFPDTPKDCFPDASDNSGQ